MNIPITSSNIPCAASHDVLAILVGTFGNVAAGTQGNAPKRWVRGSREGFALGVAPAQ